MEYFREKRRAGLIDTKTCEKMMEVVNHIEENGWTFIDVIGSGTFGSVLKIKNLKTNEEMAAKVVQKNYASEGEISLWKTLSHPNILKLTDVQFIYHADSYIFLTPVHPKNLEEYIFESSFTKNKNASSQIIEWLKQILDAVACLHGTNLSHNDLKGNNILISSNNCAIVSDFGFLCNAEKPIRKYGAPFIYRCPEGRMTESGLTEVDGKKLDIWSIGTMAFELFTGMSLLKRFAKWDEGPLTCWYTQVYPLIQNSLEKKNFINLMNDAFPVCKINHTIADDVLNFITGCLSLVPQNRPSVQQLQNYKLFGGTSQYANDQVDIWKSKVSVREFNTILKQNELDLVPENESVDSHSDPYSERGDNKDLKTYGETYKVEVDPIVIPEFEIIHDKKENNQNEMALRQRDQSFENKPHRQSSTIISGQAVASIFDYIFDTPVSSLVSVSPPTHKISELDNVPVISQYPPSSRRQKFRKWWKQKKASFIVFLTACCSCARKDTHRDELSDCK